ncbi:beta-ketoacyl synthase N-terminal-like domain-containing protein [Plantactinospora endophytica]|uniref:Actinorhodin polyketide beta-ketoacyl synthase n=1 Tax=Plantactinospora endophytica TaxID=673535 RepID=A0ABQ4EBG3_9ACTN|nr:beta-ketoacyl synthase N-terminal-like domain-containing protein [Plantactinospora endophytica]GIG92081.1 actinorhodin polyketide beta-ketoacyl synthase [Plantactinospora endophytica]
MSRAAVITGIGVVAPTGTGVDEHWRNSLAGISGIRPIDEFDVSALPVAVAGQVAGFDQTGWVEHRLIVQTDRWTWLALAAARLALDDAGLDPRKAPPLGLSVVTASGSGGNLFGQREIQALWSTGPRAVSAYQSIGWFYAASSGQISILHQLKGQCGVLVADGAGGIDAAWQARRILARGGDAVLVGGTEAPLSPYALACQSSQRTLSAGGDAATAYRPFAADATGGVPGEGGAMLVVEPRHRAYARGARVYAELAGAAATHDAYDPEEPAPDCRHLTRAIRQALDRARCGPDDVDVVFADGAGDRQLDRLEAAALGEVFGAGAVPVTVPKTMTGRLCSGAAPLDLGWAALALHHGVIPPSVNVAADPGYGLDLVVEPRPARLRRALVVARGSGGFNSAAVLAAASPEADR